MKSLVAYLGPDWTYSHMAVQQFQPERDRQVACNTIDDVFAAILSGKSDCGIVPLHNSASGLVNDTAASILRRLLGIDTLADQVWWKQPLCISGNLFVPVKHCLIGHGQPEEVRQVLSKQQALDQCGKWLAENTPFAQQVAVDSSAAALPLLTNDSQLAAIASVQAAKAADIPIIAQNIQDQMDNATEFVIVQRDDQLGYVAYADAGEPLSEYWIAERRLPAHKNQADNDRLPGIQIQNLSSSAWCCDFEFASRYFYCFKCNTNETFEAGQPVTLETGLEGKTDDPIPLKKWRLGIG